jgi:hypothetical protein
VRGKTDVFGLTDRGKVRPDNEDQFLFADLSKSMLLHQTSLNLEDHTRLFGATQGSCWWWPTAWAATPPATGPAASPWTR